MQILRVRESICKILSGFKAICVSKTFLGCLLGLSNSLIVFSDYHLSSQIVKFLIVFLDCLIHWLSSWIVVDSSIIFFGR